MQSQISIWFSLLFSPCLQCNQKMETSYPARAVIYYCAFDWAVGNCLWQQKILTKLFFPTLISSCLWAMVKQLKLSFYSFHSYQICWPTLFVPNELLVVSYTIPCLTIFQVTPTQSKNVPGLSILYQLLDATSPSPYYFLCSCLSRE